MHLTLPVWVAEAQAGAEGGEALVKRRWEGGTQTRVLYPTRPEYSCSALVSCP
jgi:hypothetical protein